MPVLKGGIWTRISERGVVRWLELPRTDRDCLAIIEYEGRDGTSGYVGIHPLKTAASAHNILRFYNGRHANDNCRR